MKKNIIVKDKQELQKIIEQEINDHGNNCDLNHIDMSQITDMSELFYKSPFNGDINKWNTSNVKTMYSMFYKSSFDGDISQWDVSNVEQMGAMFKRTIFNENKKAFYDVRNYKSYKIQ